MEMKPFESVVWLITWFIGKMVRVLFWFGCLLIFFAFLQQPLSATFPYWALLTIKASISIVMIAMFSVGDGWIVYVWNNLLLSDQKEDAQ